MSQFDCVALQERMPEVASGNDEWSAGEAAHLVACDDCAREWRLVSAARRLGDSAADRVDPVKLAGQVLTGVRAAERRSRWRRASWVSGLAAAAVVVLVIRTTIPDGFRSAAPDTTAVAAAQPVSDAIPMAELDALDADQLQAVLEHLDAAAGTAEGGGVPQMGDLDDQQLERILRSLEG